MEAISKKQQSVIHTAKELFWKHGYRRVTVEEICIKAKVSKMTFYRFYANKLELAKAVFDMVIDNAIKDFKVLINEDISPSEKMRRMLLMKLEGTNDISKEFLMDFYNNPDLGVAGYIEKRTAEVWHSIVEDFRRGQQEGWIRKDFKPELILILSQKVMELVKDENALRLYGSPQEFIMEIANFITYGIANHD
ncbi:MAG TPA: TetR/AcrR family transcriptional regulator [Tenuifilaceae bacterium]|nr:TetR/AcrR family transcriptional regulator [Tenuifilaceae bacterium]HPE17326.1 TetR/AcrR family transcriptional regulator [Tenuifilaceae bacterium]HPJ44552.1 TetR/AcrR family transcriptional regulator [Tenuifilaceae bacterium]HPQ34859.1 TetR/AcrR family transcriptional regulator [Tenuifilaceae bacterium]HRX67634.1 TetR/AcrR family transcriptional regulator [Tenuifilaceae bacterium]